MTEALVCLHGMPSPAACVDCMDEGPVAPPVRWEKVGAPQIALYDGVCIGCDHTEIPVGARIQRWDRPGAHGLRTAWLHEGCTP